MTSAIDPGLLNRLAQLEPAAALAELAAVGLVARPTAAALADAALEQAEAEPGRARRWLDLADEILVTAGVEAREEAVRAQVRYAQARLLVVEGDLPGAESALRAARAGWLATGDQAAFARSGLGLTTVLAIQGRYAEAEEVIRASIDALARLAPDTLTPTLLDAQHNLATLLSYQERHGEALAIHEAVRAGCEQLLQTAGSDERSTLASLAVQTGLAIALAQTFLDRPGAAEHTLLGTVAQATAAGDTLNRGRARTNLAHLYQRTGRYAEALEQLSQAAADLLGTDDVDGAGERWPASAVLFLEQATVYLALNLLPEAAAALRRAVQLFERTAQPYELGQALYYSGLLAGAEQGWAAAAASLARAGDLFVDLRNDYWRNRVRLAQAGLAAAQGDATTAVTLLDTLSGDAAPGDETLRWDGPVRAEADLLRGRLALLSGAREAARAAARSAAQALGLPGPDSQAAALLPQLQIRLLHLLGALEQQDGNPAAAQRHFFRAVDLLESLRVALPLEEIRSAFLADKTALYADLTLSLLDTQAGDTAEVAAVEAAFAVVERARSRALLERLIASLDERAQGGQEQPLELNEQMAGLRQRLHWLYNQLVEGGKGRRVALKIGEEIRTCEASLQALEWQAAPWLRQAEPVTLGALQAVLAADESALVYFTAGAEVLVFVVKPHDVQVHRRICELPALEAAAAELRFQLGRAEMEESYVARHAARLLGGAQRALHRLHDLVLAPVAASLPPGRLLIVPHGILHGIPFAALWDGAAHALDRWECSMAASASMAVHLRAGRSTSRGYDSLAALALRDPAIPQAEAEVQAAAAHFAQVRRFLDAAADLPGLRQAAGAGAILHIATHGLFRPDNPFFSALKLADGWIDVREIYRLPLTARLVVLSACESGAQQVQGGDEAIGLARGFLGAGAEQLVVSLWNVHDASAARLMHVFYASLTGEPGTRPAAALRFAQRHAAGQHPYFWAPFVAIG